MAWFTVQVERQAHLQEHVSIIVDASLIDAQPDANAKFGQPVQRHGAAAQSQI